MKTFLLQMAGEPGTGKSSLARKIGKATSAVIIDKDYIKSPLIEKGFSDEEAGSLSYTILFSLAESLLEHDQSVILDSPAYYAEIREQGQALADKASVDYRLIECVCSDVAKQEKRLQKRERLPSQMSSVEEIDLSRPGIVPLDEARRVLDTVNADKTNLKLALEYIKHG